MKLPLGNSPHCAPGSILVTATVSNSYRPSKSEPLPSSALASDALRSRHSSYGALSVGTFAKLVLELAALELEMKPSQTPKNPCFSSGPCAKRPGWSFDALQDAALGRSHRAKIGKDKLADVIHRSKKVLGIPDAYVLGVVPASDTGAVEMALWSLLGERGVDILAWEAFSIGWATDCKNQLRLKDLRVFNADYGRLPDLDQVDWTRDVVFAWNGTTSGVKVPSGDWIAADREGLSICDATSAVFAM